MRSAITMSGVMRTATSVWGPEHDWSSHAADSFGYMAISYEEPPAKAARVNRREQPRSGSHWSA